MQVLFWRKVDAVRRFCYNKKEYEVSKWRTGTGMTRRCGRCFRCAPGWWALMAAAAAAKPRWRRRCRPGCPAGCCTPTISTCPRPAAGRTGSRCLPPTWTWNGCAGRCFCPHGRGSPSRCGPTAVPRGTTPRRSRCRPRQSPLWRAVTAATRRCGTAMT